MTELDVLKQALFSSGLAKAFIPTELASKGIGPECDTNGATCSNIGATCSIRAAICNSLAACCTTDAAVCQSLSAQCQTQSIGNLAVNDSENLNLDKI